MNTLTIIRIGNSNGVIFPQRVLNKLKCSAGDKLYVIETPNGIKLTPYNPEFATDMKLANKIMKTNQNMFKKLAN